MGAPRLTIFTVYCFFSAVPSFETRMDCSSTQASFSMPGVCLRQAQYGSENRRSHLVNNERGCTIFFTNNSTRIKKPYANWLVYGLVTRSPGFTPWYQELRLDEKNKRLLSCISYIRASTLPYHTRRCGRHHEPCQVGRLKCLLSGPRTIFMPDSFEFFSWQMFELLLCPVCDRRRVFCIRSSVSMWDQTFLAQCGPLASPA